MESFLQGLDGVICFLGDMLIMGTSRFEHINRPEKVLPILENAVISISHEKCKFFQQQVKYLGFIISKDGIHSWKNKKLF